MRTIDYNQLIGNIDDMINALEFDSMRSGGKCKVNAPVLNDLYTLRDRLVKKAKPNTRKEG